MSYLNRINAQETKLLETLKVSKDDIESKHPLGSMSKSTLEEVVSCIEGMVKIDTRGAAAELRHMISFWKKEIPSSFESWVAAFESVSTVEDLLAFKAQQRCVDIGSAEKLTTEERQMVQIFENQEKQNLLKKLEHELGKDAAKAAFDKKFSEVKKTQRASWIAKAKQALGTATTVAVTNESRGQSKEKSGPDVAIG